MTPKTKKAAREAGYLTVHSARIKRLVPLRDAKPTMVKGEKYFLPNQCEKLVSETEAKRHRLRVPNEKEPVTWYHRQIAGVKRFYYAAYRWSDCVPMRRPNRIIPPCIIDLLLAIFIVNKSAKRYRDSAQSNYNQRQHGFAGHAKRTKEQLYALKEKGIAEAYRQGRLSFVGIHGNMGLYRGEGYCFHSTTIPESCELPHEQQECVFIEAAPKGAGEGRLKDAIHTLEALAENEDSFQRLYWSDNRPHTI